MMLLALLVLGQVTLSDEGGAKKSVNHINCVGAGITCSTSSTFGTITVSGGGTGAPSSATYITQTCNASLSAEQCLSGNGTGIMISTTGTGVVSTYAGTSCTNQFPRSLNASGAATCASVALGSDVSGTLGVSNGGTGSAPASDDQVLVSDSTSAATWRSVPNCTDTAGQHLNYTASTNGWSCGTSTGAATPGGSSSQVQYNNSGAFGGISAVESDGTHQRMVAVSAHPSATSVGKLLPYAFLVDGGAPSMPFYNEGTIGVPTPMGMLAEFSQIGSAVNWDTSCVWPETWASATLKTYRTSASQVSGTASGNAWANTSLLTRLKVTTYFTSAAKDNGATVRGPTGEFQMWRGDSAGAGGIIWWGRMLLKVTSSKNRMFAGLSNSTTAQVLGTDPSTLIDTVYFGCDSNDSNINICSNDNSGTATCADLGAGFPCKTAGAYYDFLLWAAPNASVIGYYAQRLDSAQSAGSEISTDLPRNTVQLAWHETLGTGDGGTSVTLGFMGSCFASNF